MVTIVRGSISLLLMGFLVTCGSSSAESPTENELSADSGVLFCSDFEDALLRVGRDAADLAEAANILRTDHIEDPENIIVQPLLEEILTRWTSLVSDLDVLLDEEDQCLQRLPSQLPTIEIAAQLDVADTAIGMISEANDADDRSAFRDGLANFEAAVAEISGSLQLLFQQSAEQSL